MNPTPPNPPTPKTLFPAIRSKASALLALMGLTMAAATPTFASPPSTPSPTPAAPSPAMHEDPIPPGFPGNAKATLSLFAKHAALAPGLPGTLGIKIIHEPHWHTYFPAANDSGVPTSVAVDRIVDQTGQDVAEHVKLGPLTFPAPVRYINEGDILDHVLEGDATLLLPVSIKPTLAKDVKTVTFDLTVDFLICKETCLPGRKSLRLTVPIDPAKAKLVSDDTELNFRLTEARLPTPLTPEIAKAQGISITWQPTTAGSSPTLIIAAAPRPRTASKLEFYPLEDAPRPENLIPGGTGIETLNLVFSAPKAANSSPASPVKVKGILMVQPISKPPSKGRGEKGAEADVEAQSPPNTQTSPETEKRANHTAMRLAGPNFYLIETNLPTPAKTPSESAPK
jgi:DsbC/DsbD-like thiol-disulfide interchange protein